METPPTDMHGDDDDVETAPCYRHPGRQTALSCASCERPICVDCAITAAVGMKCHECGRLPRAALAQVPTARLVRGALAGAAAGMVAGAVYSGFRFGFFGLIVAGLLGMGVGEAVRWASGGFRDRLLGRVAGVCAFVGLAFPTVLSVTLAVAAGADASVLASSGVLFTLLGAAVAAVVAFNRAS